MTFVNSLTGTKHTSDIAFDWKKRENVDIRVAADIEIIDEDGKIVDSEVCVDGTGTFVR